ncbi:septal ring lytic transglycosylase RlpA family protein [Pollutimonas harenae]|nr:septal ring lytic transglycosylase RlpA family protein [Pollutimonas harenae]
MRAAVTIVLSAGLLVLAGCGTSGSDSGSSGKGGGYYKDDGPGSNIPANIEAIPNAVPRIEKHAKANFRPYVVFGKRYVPVSDEKPFRQEGKASWYGRKFHGKKTANGETYDMYAMSAAHPTLPLPSYARVTRASSGKSVIVRINDRGPFHSSRIIDLSYVAAAKLGLIGPGSGQVIVEAITNQDIRSNNVEQAKPKPIPSAPPVQPKPVLVTQTEAPAPALPATPDAMAALQHNDGRGLDISPPDTDPVHIPGTEARAAVISSTASTAAATPSGQIYLQFGAFSAAHTAENLAQKISSQIQSVESRPAKVQESKQLYRVRVGPYASRTEAVNAAMRIQQETGRQPAIALN